MIPPCCIPLYIRTNNASTQTTCISTSYLCGLLHPNFISLVSDRTGWMCLTIVYESLELHVYEHIYLDVNKINHYY